MCCELQENWLYWGDASSTNLCKLKQNTLKLQEKFELSPGSPLGNDTHLVHVSICATSHPLNEFEVVLGVPPLDFSVGSREDVHGWTPPLHI